MNEFALPFLQPFTMGQSLSAYRDAVAISDNMKKKSIKEQPNFAQKAAKGYLDKYEKELKEQDSR